MDSQAQQLTKAVPRQEIPKCREVQFSKPHLQLLEYAMLKLCDTRSELQGYCCQKSYTPLS